MLIRILIIVAGCLCCTTAQAQTSLYRVSLDDRIAEAEVIVEGRVVEQLAFWNVKGTLIYTANLIEVYRVFKGSLAADRIELVTEGGQVGLTMHRVDPTLRLRTGEVGLFFVEHTDTRNAQTAVPADHKFQAYASVQGFVKYDESSGHAEDVFQVYKNIERDLYAPLTRALGREPQVFHAYSLPRARPVVQKSVDVAPAINSFSPNPITAGTKLVLTIVGSGFGTYDGGTNSLVSFSNPDDGGMTFVPAPQANIISWSDTQITLTVPTKAGTGVFIVQNANREKGRSPSILTIDFSQSTFDSGGQLFEPNLQNKNGAGGYSFAMSTSTANGGVDFSTSAAVAPFESALQSWQTQTGYHVFNDGGTTASNLVAPSTDPDIVMFDNNAAPLPSGVLGLTYTSFKSCDGTVWYIFGFDVVFRRNRTGGVTWNFGPGVTQSPFSDFESVAVHELGHTHQLGHIIAPGRVMHFALKNGTDVRVLNPTSDIAGGFHVLRRSVSLNTCNGTITGMVPLISVSTED